MSIARLLWALFLASIAISAAANGVWLIATLFGLFTLGALANVKQRPFTPTPSTPKIRATVAIADPLDVLRQACPAYATDHAGDYAVATSRGRLKFFNDYTSASTYADTHAEPTAIGRVPSPAQVSGSGAAMFRYSALSKVSYADCFPQATDAQITAYILAAASGRSLKLSAVQELAAMTRMQEGLKIWPTLYASAPLELVAALAEQLHSGIFEARIVTAEQLTWNIVARAEYEVAVHALRSRFAATRETYAPA